MSDKTYEMIGGDGEQYGPFTIEQLQDNLSHSRANAQTQIRETGTEAWQPLGQVLGNQSIENFAEYREAILTGTGDWTSEWRFQKGVNSSRRTWRLILAGPLVLRRDGPGLRTNIFSLFCGSPE